MDDDSTQSAPDRIDSSDVSVDKRIEHGGAYGANCALIDALEAIGVSSNITPGGIAISISTVTDDNRAQFDEVLHEWGVRTLSANTLQEEIGLAGSFDKAAAKRPLGRAGRVAKKLDGDEPMSRN